MKIKLLFLLPAVAAVLFLFAPDASAQLSGLDGMPLTSDRQYLVVGSVPLQKTTDGAAGTLLMLRDARLNGDFPFRQNKGERPGFYRDDPQLEERFAREPFRPAVLRLLDSGGRIVDSVTLGCVQADLRRIFLVSKTRPIYEVTCNFEYFDAYGGPETVFYELKNERFERIGAYDARTGAAVPLELVRSRLSGWEYARANRGQDILRVLTDYRENGAAGGEFFVRYQRFRFDGRRWVFRERIEKNRRWDFEEEFPKRSSFPQASAK